MCIMIIKLYMHFNKFNKLNVSFVNQVNKIRDYNLGIPNNNTNTNNKKALRKYKYNKILCQCN